MSLLAGDQSDNTVTNSSLSVDRIPLRDQYYHKMYQRPTSVLNPHPLRQYILYKPASVSFLFLINL